MYKKILWAATFACSLVFGQTAFADSMGCKGLKSMVQSLNLDAAQKEKIQPILDQLKSNMQSMGTEMDSLEPQVNQQVNSPSMDQSAVDGLVDKKAKIIGDMMKAKINAKNQIVAILNPEQKIKLQDMVQQEEKKIADKFKECHNQD